MLPGLLSFFLKEVDVPNYFYNCLTPHTKVWCILFFVGQADIPGELS